MSLRRRRAVGAEIVDGGVHFRVWAPAHRSVFIVFDDGARELALDREEGGYFSLLVASARAGTRYRFRLGENGDTFPDPASRFQPDGPHQSSMVVDPSAYRWSNPPRNTTLRDAVIYEMHFGTFTREGTYIAAIDRLRKLKDIGITVLEIMPIHEFGERFGWGYDGVDLWAPAHIYGPPDDLRRFIDAAHAIGLSVILDVVYNHFGPDGCYITQFTPEYFTKKYVNDWGDSINFDGESSRGVREYFVENAAYWIDEFHFDGLRLDATQSLNDASDPHVMADVVSAARKAAPGRDLLIVGENEPQDVKLLERYGLDGLWNDDFHHAAMVAATGRAEAYYWDYRGAPQEFVSMARYGFLFQGQRYSWQKGRRGTPSLHIAAERFIWYLQNHDQVANSATGKRLHQLTSAGNFRALTALLLLGPATPMLFQGQEFAASTPFLYFADHDPELAGMVATGRKEFLAQFPSIATIPGESLAAPHDPKTFESSKLDWSERETNQWAVRLHRDLLRLRREMPRDAEIGGAVLSEEAFLLRWITRDHADQLLLINLGRDLRYDPAPEPLLAPPAGARWNVMWSSESPDYEGGGCPAIEGDFNWFVPGHSAVLLRAER
ncbi:MAG: malto-oligosyltrehalose trehalohydrolase, partial [Thermoanaerobaculia bacterium]